MKKIFILFSFLFSLGNAQVLLHYYSGAEKIDSTQVNKNVREKALEINRMFHFINDSRHYYIKIMNINGKTYAQSISERVYLSHDSNYESGLFRKIENLTNVKIEDGKFISDQLKAQFAYVKETGRSYKNGEIPPIKLMICSDNGKVKNCRINDNDVPIELMGKYPEVSYKRLNYEELKNKNSKELRLMKSEVYARYGHNFTEKDLKEYFYKFLWYEPIINNDKVELTEIEQDNVSMISVFEKQIPYKNLNNQAYDQIMNIGVAKSTLYDKKNNLRNIKVTGVDNTLQKTCISTEYNKEGIISYKEDCINKKQLLANYFRNNILVQHLTEENDTYFYYNEEGLPSKMVVLDYENNTTGESKFTYNEDFQVIKTDTYLGNYFVSVTEYEYNQNGNLVKIITKDPKGKITDQTEYIYDEISRGQETEEYVYGDIVDPSSNLEESNTATPANLIGNTGFIKNDGTGCDYTYNDRGDMIMETKNFKLEKDQKRTISTKEVEIIKEKRDKENQLILAELLNNEQASMSKKETKETLEIKYY